LLRNLQRFLGREVWRHCVLLLTFSNEARQVELFSAGNSYSGYKEHLNAIVGEFSVILKEACSSEVSSVRMVFNRPNTEGIDDGEDCIVAIPVGKKLNSTKDILPGIDLDSDKGWTDIVFKEMMKKSGESSKTVLLKLKCGSAGRSVSSSALMGLAVGAGVGAMVGAVAGPLGMLSAGSVGAATGVAIARALHKKRRQRGTILKFSQLKFKND